MKRIAMVLLALGAAACSSGSAIVPANLKAPRSVAAFQGMAPDGSGTVVPLLAIASSRGNELRIVNPSDDTPLRAPNVSYPLAVPTMPGPTSLGAVSLGDGGPDVVLVASGGTLIQLVGTWLDGYPVSDGYGVVWTEDISTWNLGPLAGAGNQILTATGGAIPSGPGTGTPSIAPATVGSGRVFLGLAGGDDGLGGKLLVLEFARVAGGDAITLVSDPTDASNVVRLGFNPDGLAFSPDNTHLYVASRDAIPGSGGAPAAYGIAEIDTSSGTPSTWTVRQMPGRAPTTSVFAAILGERTAGDPKVFGPPVARVYAAVSAADCGRDKEISCGIATYDPARGTLAADPSPGPSPIGAQVPAQAFESPLYVPGIPFGLAVAMPPASGSQRCTTPDACDQTNAGGYPQPLMALAPTSGTRWTSSAAGVAAGDGSLYLLDLGRWSAPEDSFLISDSTTRTQVSAASSALPDSSTTGNFIGLWAPPGLGALPPANSKMVRDSTNLLDAFIVWPGFTPTDSWFLEWQGIMPGLQQRRARLGRLLTGETWLAVQQPVNPSGPPPTSASDWIVGAFLTDPAVAIHSAADWGVGDIALYIPDEYPPIVCPGHEPPANSSDAVPAYETIVTRLYQPVPASFPGGALGLLVPAGTDIECLSNQIPLGTSVGVTMTVRASALVLKATGVGYAGRPVFGERYNLAWQPDESYDGNPQHDEAAMLARKARRFYYPGGPYAGISNGGPCPNDAACYAGFPEMTDPMQSGPVIGFRPGLFCTSGTCPPGATPPRDAVLGFTTASGLVPMSRRASSIAVGTWVTSFDKSVFPDDEFLGRVFYTTFIGDALMMVPPGQASNQSKLIQ